MKKRTLITRDVTDEAGNILDGAQVTIRVGHESGGALATIYADDEGATAISNPVTLDGLSDGSPAAGQLLVYADAGLYRLEGTGAAGVGFSLIDTTSFEWVYTNDTRANMVTLIADGFVPDDGRTYHLDGLAYLGETGATMLPDLAGLVPAGVWRPAHFGAVGDGITDDTATINALLSAQGASGISVKSEFGGSDGTPISYLVSGNLTFIKTTDAGYSSIDFTGSTISGAHKFIVGSTKRLKMRGLYWPNGTLDLSGCWYSSFDDCLFDVLQFGGTASARFQTNYWNTFTNLTYSKILQSGSSPSNKMEFINNTLRGDAAQGLPTVRAYALEFVGNGNCQSWVFRGGDISYHTAEIIYVNPSATGDILVEFNGVYWDTKVPQPIDRLNTRIVVNGNGYAAVDKSFAAPMKVASTGEVWTFDKDEGAGFKPASSVNWFPNGGFEYAHATQLYNTTNPALGGPIFNLNGASITEQSGGPTGRAYTITQPATSSNAVTFQTVPLPVSGVYTFTMLVRNEGVGTQDMKISFAGLFREFSVGQDWTVVTVSALAGLDVGSRQVGIYNDAGSAFELEIAYVGLTFGYQPDVLPSKTFPTSVALSRSAKAWRVIAQDAVQKVHTGNTDTTVLTSVTLNGGEMGPNGCLRVSTVWSRNSSGAGTVTPSVRFVDAAGPTLSGNVGVGLSFSTFSRTTVMQNRGSTSSQIYLNGDGGASTTQVTTPSRDTNAATTLAFCAKLADAADTLRLESLLVEVMYGA